MFCANNATGNNSSSEASSDSRMAVADILSSMASGESASHVNFSTLGGYTCGIPTKTTPTLTPTTLKNIEEFIELQSVPPEPVKHQHQAGFVPPLVSSCITSSSSSYLPEQSDSENSLDDQASSICGDIMSYQPTATKSSATPGRKSTGRMGGRRPNNSAHLTPEEAERREMRRERNKLAAARCRKRRLDHTNILVQETECLEDKRQTLQNEIQMLECQKEELRFILEAHKATCRLNNAIESMDIKPVIVPPTSDMNNMHGGVSASMSRPNSLPITSHFVSQIPSTSVNTTVSRMGYSDIAGISITTPSVGIFNFESYMEGGTGLTPVSTTGLTPVIPSCSTQQRNSSSDMSSPDTVNPPKLVSL